MLNIKIKKDKLRLSVFVLAILHRAFSVFLFNSKKELLLQKRSNTKITFPSVWSNSCCSHPHFNHFEMDTTNNFIGVKRAVSRKIQHELGIKKTKDIHVMGRFIYQADHNSEWSEHELDYAIIIPNCDERICYNTNEVCDIRFVKQDELIFMMQNKQYSFSPWLKLFTKFQFLNLWWSNLDNLNDVKDREKIHKLV